MTDCLDSWAILRWLEGAEPAASRVEAVLSSRPVMSWINLGEVAYIVERMAGVDRARQVVQQLRQQLVLDLPSEARVLDGPGSSRWTGNAAIWRTGCSQKRRRTTSPISQRAKRDQSSWPGTFATTGGVENRGHWVRDVTWDEDRSTVRTGSGPQVLATLRNLAISLLRLAPASPTWPRAPAGPPGPPTGRSG